MLLHRRAFVLLPVLILSSPTGRGPFPAARAATHVYRDSGDWPAEWTAQDEVWMNAPGASLSVPEGRIARIDTLIVGRHTDAALTVDGGALDMGSGDGAGALLAGQYAGADGRIHLNSGRVDVAGGLAVSVFGAGSWDQGGGTARVRDRFAVGAYDRPEAVGTVRLRAGSVVAGRFDMNQHSILRLEGGVLALDGDRLSTVRGHADAGRIAGANGAAPALFYDDVSSRTYAYSKVGGLFPTYYGRPGDGNPEAASDVGEFPSWFDPSLWPPHYASTPLPGPGSEVWMNSPDTAARVGPGEVAAVEKLVVGRKVGPVSLAVDGGELLVGDDDSAGAILFLGQYSGSDARLVLASGRVRVAGELAVGVFGRGALDCRGGRIDVLGRLVLGRYSQGRGDVFLDGGEVHVERLDINGPNSMDLRGGILHASGDQRSKMTGYVAGGQILSRGSNKVKVSYDAAVGRTIVEGLATVAPTNAPTPKVSLVSLAQPL